MEFFPLLLQDYCSRLLRNDGSLVELNLKCAELNNHNECFRALLERLKSSETVRILDLYGNALGSGGDCLYQIGSLLRNNQFLRVVNLDKNAINCNSLDILVQGLRHNASVVELSLNDNHIGPRGGITLGNFLAINNGNAIQKLSLKRNRIGTRGAVAIFRGLTQNCKYSKMKELSLCGNDIMGQQTFSTSQTSLISDTGNDEALEETIQEMLRVNHNLKVLNLSGNGLGTSPGVVATIACGLRDNDTVQELDLSENELDDKDAVALAKSLAVNRTLRTLHLCRNANIGIPGIKALLHCIRVYNLYMESITLSSCGGGGDGEEFQDLEKELTHWLETNQAGRLHVYQNSTTLPYSLWPLVLARVSDRPNVLCCFLLAKPDLVMPH